MKKLIGSKWFAAVIGVVAFAATMVVMILFQKPEEHAARAPAGTNTVSGSTNALTNATSAAVSPEAHAPADHGASEEGHKPTLAPPAATVAFTGAIGEPGTLAFNNPDVKLLIDELRREKTALLAKEHRLDELAKQLALQKAEIASITQEVLNAKAALMLGLTNQMNVRDKTEETRLKDLAQVYTNMPPVAAARILDGMTVDDVAKILAFMNFSSQAQILENFATNEATKASGKATEISERIRKLGEKPLLPTKR